MYSLIHQEKYAAYNPEFHALTAKYTTIGCGGIADAIFFPSTIEQLVELVANLRSDGVPFDILGQGANVLPADDLSGKVIICTKRINEICVQQEKIFVSAGVSSGALLKACREHNLSGVEFFTGIPSTMGGALYMNAGVADGHIADVVQSVLILRNGRIETIQKDECQYGYKTSVFMFANDVILGATLGLKKAVLQEIDDKIHAFKTRRAHLPKGKSMGCVFKNPTGYFAGALIENSGLKGLRIGGAVVSNEHANFIINDQGATSSDVKRLIETVKNAVFAQYKIRLEEEIRYINR